MDERLRLQPALPGPIRYLDDDDREAIVKAAEMAIGLALNHIYPNLRDRPLVIEGPTDGGLQVHNSDNVVSRVEFRVRALGSVEDPIALTRAGVRVYYPMGRRRRPDDE